jgi:hypothetical protein
MAYGYLDKYGVLHVVEGKEVAENSAKDGKVVETGVPNAGGYPTYEGESVVVYAADEAYISGNRNDGAGFALEKAPAILDLFKALS